MNLLPLIVVVLPVILVTSALSIYRSLYPLETVRDATKIIAEYRILKQRAKSKKDLKRLKTLEPRYRRARSLLLRSVMVKLFLLLSGYVAGSVLVFVTVPVLVAPYHIPPLTVASESGYYMLSITAYFLVYVVLFIVLRDSFL